MEEERQAARERARKVAPVVARQANRPPRVERTVVPAPDPSELLGVVKEPGS
jgi:hypothetical protein